MVTDTDHASRDELVLALNAATEEWDNLRAEVCTLKFALAMRNRDVRALREKYETPLAQDALRFVGIES